MLKNPFKNNFKAPDLNRNRKKGSFNFSILKGLLWLVSFALIIYFFSGSSSEPKQTSRNTFENEMIKEKEVQKVIIIDGEKVEIYLTPEALTKPKYSAYSKGTFNTWKQGPHFYFLIGSSELFEQRLEKAQQVYGNSEQIDVSYERSTNGWITFFSWIFPIAILFIISRFLIKNYTSNSISRGQNVFDFGKSSPQIFDSNSQSKITFKDVAGYSEAKTEIMEVVDFLKQPENFTKLGAKIPRGILLIGAPGTGKTLLAKAVAGEAGVPFFSLSGSEFIEMFVGVGASRVRDLFRQAKMRAPSIVFIDEIDTIGRMRSKALSFQSNDERDSTLNQLLAEMDGFGPNTGVIVLAATNRADILDPALLRPGRFDRHIHLDLPTKLERQEIFKVHLKPLILDKEVHEEDLATETPGFSGADIANICNEAALIAARKKKNKINKDDFRDSIDRIVSGIEKKGKIISTAEKKIIAYHEAGHALISWVLKNVDPLQKVSIIPRGKSLGGAWYLPEEHEIFTKTQLMERLCATLGGRSAEELVFNDVSSGAIDDLEKVTKQAYMMVGQLGFSKKLENISYYDSTGVAENSFQKPYSEATAKLIDEEVRILLFKANHQNLKILKEHRFQLDQIAQALIDKEEIFKEEIESILGKREHIAAFEAV